MELDTLREVSGQVVGRKVGGQWVIEPRPEPPTGAESHAPTPTGGGSAPSLSLCNNCNGSEVKVGTFASRKSYNAKRKEAVRLNVAAAVEQYGIEHVAVFTLTFPDRLVWSSVDDWKEAKRRWHSFRSGVMGKLFLGGVGVWEPSPSGRIHLHAVVGCRDVVRGAFDFQAFAQACQVHQESGDSPEFKRLRSVYASSAPEGLRALWAEIRERAPDYEIGRCETVPVKSPEGFGFYVGKYLGKVDGEEWCQGFKGRRLTRWGNFVPGAVMSFAWVRTISGVERRDRGEPALAVGKSAAYESPSSPGEAKVHEADVRDRSGFRSFVGHLVRDGGMGPLHTVESVKRRLGCRWAWRMANRYREFLARARDQGSQAPEAEAARATVIDLHLWGMGPEAEAAAVPGVVPPGEVVRVLEAFGGEVISEC